MANQFTEPPWYFDADRIIYAPNGRPGATTVATLRSGANAKLLAAAPNLLRALEDSLECLVADFHRSTPSKHRNDVRDAKECAETAINRARFGYPENTAVQRAWTVDPEHPQRKANERLLDAAADLLDAATKAHTVAGHVDNHDVVTALRHAIARAARD